jgi:hypothetical protein
MRFAPALLLAVFVADPASASNTVTDGEVQQAVAEGIRNALDPDGIGAAVAVRIDGRTLFFNFCSPIVPASCRSPRIRFSMSLRWAKYST